MGQSANTGERRFDAYFDDVASLRDNVESLNSDLFPIREPLVERMDVDVDATLYELMAVLSQRVAKFRDYGVTLNVRLSPEPIVIKDRGELEEDEADDALIKAIQESATRAVVTYREYSQLLLVVAELDKQRGKLAERIERLPDGDPKRDAIEAEILGAGRVLRKAEQKLSRDTRTLSHFLVARTQAVDTGAAAARDAKCEDAIAKRRKPRKRWRGRGRRPAPRPKPATGGDFEM